MQWRAVPPPSAWGLHVFHDWLYLLDIPVYVFGEHQISGPDWLDNIVELFSHFVCSPACISNVCKRMVKNYVWRQAVNAVCQRSERIELLEVPDQTLWGAGVTTRHWGLKELTDSTLIPHAQDISRRNHVNSGHFENLWAHAVSLSQTPCGESHHHHPPTTKRQNTKQDTT